MEPNAFEALPQRITALAARDRSLGALHELGAALISFSHRLDKAQLGAFPGHESIEVGNRRITLNWQLQAWLVQQLEAAQARPHLLRVRSEEATAIAGTQWRSSPASLYDAAIHWWEGTKIVREVESKEAIADGAAREVARHLRAAMAQAFESIEEAYEDELSSSPERSGPTTRRLHRRQALVDTLFAAFLGMSDFSDGPPGSTPIDVIIRAGAVDAKMLLQSAAGIVSLR